MLFSVKTLTKTSFGVAVMLLVFCAGRAAAEPSRVMLRNQWQLRSSTSERWYSTSVPTTVLAALVANKVYPDPYLGMNLRAIPGTSYPIGRNFSALPMPDDSPFRRPWRFRTEFETPAGSRDSHVALHFDGINYRANIWVNGRQIAESDRVAGTFRLFEFDITDIVRRSGRNTLEVEVFPPDVEDLAITWVDWNPAPPDKNMGIWRDVYITTTGDVALRDPFVATHLNTTLTQADLAISAEVRNLSDRTVEGMLRGKIESMEFSQRVSLNPKETKTIRFTQQVTNPRLWWPAEAGTPNLYEMTLEFDDGKQVSDRQTTRFGIREITSEFNEQGGRLFKVNRRPILIRGGGWAPDMLLRAIPDRQESEIRYVRDMNLNTIRMEGKLEDDHFFDLADRYGILILPGWCCCDHWEQWPKWKPENYEIAAASQRDQIRRLRNHPSVLAWLNGSDNPPPPDVERTYVEILKESEWPNPYISSATAKPTPMGPSGVKMTGPYDWVPPSYWLADKTRGGAYGFNTETSPGPAIPEVESLRAMLPADHLWPIDDYWNYHAGGGQFRTIQRFADALTARYGAASGLEDFVVKSQLMAYEGERAMFEAYTRNRYTSTGVIQWMLNNAWPAIIWHLYDYYLQPAAGYFATKKACEPLHVQYSYDDRSVVAINGTEAAIDQVKISARIFSMDLRERFSREATIRLAADGTTRAFVLPDLQEPQATYFVDLRMLRPTGEMLSTNFYWLSPRMDDPDWDKSTYFITPVKTFANFGDLGNLPPAALTSSIRLDRKGNDESAVVTLTNSGKTLAFFLRLKLTKGTSNGEILPILWQDNYISLLPGETRQVRADYKLKDRGSPRPVLVISGWNVKPSRH